MEKSIFLVLSLLLSVSLLALNETKTIGQTEFSAIQAACAGGDDLIYNYYEERATSANVSREEWGPLVDDMGVRQDFLALNYANKALVGALGLENNSEIFLDEAFDYILNPNSIIIDDYISIAYDVIPYMTKPVEDPDEDASIGQRGLDIGYTLENLALIIDMLWWYEGGIHQSDLYLKLDSLSCFTHRRINYSRPGGHEADSTNVEDYQPGVTWDYLEWPGIWAHNFSLRAYGALGYAGVVLENEEYINFVDFGYMNFEWNGEEAFWGYGSNGEPVYRYPYIIDGYLNHNIQDSGIYTEGLSYMSYSMDGMNLFFTARARYDEENYYDYEIIQNMFEESIFLVSPDFSSIGFDDVWSKTSSLHTRLPKGYLECYQIHNNTNPGLDNNIKWYINEYENHFSNYPPLGSDAIPLILSYNSKSFSGSSLPTDVVEKNYSNDEFSILRNNIENIEEFKNFPTMFINHENSRSCAAHEHRDQTSFILYYEGRNLLIDPGYSSYQWAGGHGRRWLNSPYAHNLILISHDIEADFINEYDNLVTDYNNFTGEENVIKINRIEPVAVSSFESIEVTANQAFKDYLYENGNISSLKIAMQYDNTGEDVNVDLSRHFYFIDNNYYIIYDNLINLENQNLDFCNQLHFEGYNTTLQGNDIQILTANQDGTFNFTAENYSALNNPYLYGAMGCLNIGSVLIKDNLPFGLYQGNDDHIWEHRCLRTISQATNDTQFLTLLIPSECYADTIDYVFSGTGQYAAKYSLNTGYNCYAAVSDGNYIDCDNGNTRFVTDASFLLIEANCIFTDLTKLILNSDNFLEVQDMGGTDFVDVVVFDSDYDSEEVISEWTENDELEITTVMSFTSPIPLPIPNPKYKILRCGVLPEDLISKTYYYSSGDLTNPDRGTINNNIESLAYNENYFYVNYEYDDLVTENLLTEELTIYSGIFDNIEISGISKFGLGEIEFSDEIIIPIGTEMKFVSGSNPLMAKDTRFVVSGQVTAIGNSLNIIEFDKKSLDDWVGFYIDSDGEVDFEYCKFSSAECAIQCFGDIDLSNSEITNCYYGLQINSPTSYKVNDNTISYCNHYGAFISNTSFLITASHFENNYIFHCKYGLFLYNTNAEINDNAIYNNYHNGMYISRRSYPIIQSCLIDSTRNGAIDNPEIYLIDDSYPVLDNNYNDIIIESGGHSKSIYNASGGDSRYYCRNNFWGDGITTTEIEQSFYPAIWDVIYLPICDSSNTEFVLPGRSMSLFEEGLQAEKNGYLLLAKDLYLLSIEQNPDEIESLWSASRLLNCVDPDIGFGYNEAQQLYEEIMIDSLNTDLYELSRQSAINCDRKMENFQEAIYQYELMFNDSLTIIDSVFIQLDIVYTYMEAEAVGGRASGLRFSSDAHAVRNAKHAKEMENNLLSLLMQETDDGGVYSPIVEKVKLHGNYPNPFNPTTMISFSIPDESKVKLTIYNIKGQKVKTLVNESLVKGIHEVLWNGRNDNNRSVASGVYFYRLNVNKKTEKVKKMLLLK